MMRRFVEHVQNSPQTRHAVMHVKVDCMLRANIHSPEKKMPLYFYILLLVFTEFFSILYGID